ncbi:MAG: FkbM family methyltransferase [Candidatus Eremiobacteraeota bacterium]|nr:FkbM family methyltransferase [Candidatus Eremiobacteraeota bacterium]
MRNRALSMIDFHTLAQFGRSAILSALRAFHGNRMRVRAHGHPFYVDLRDNIISTTIVLTGRWENHEATFFRKVVRPGDFILDVGAHVGYFTTLLGSLAGAQGRVAALEPDPENAKLLRTNVAAAGLDSVVRVHEAGAGAARDRLVLYKNPTNRGDHHTYDDNTDGKRTVRAQIPVDIVTIDEIVRDWTKVDLIKMDIQGYEGRALKGALDTLARYPDIILATEFWPGGMKRAGSDPLLFVTELHELGFLIHELRKDGTLAEVRRQEFLQRFASRDRDFADIICARQGNKRLRELLPPR